VSLDTYKQHKLVAMGFDKLYTEHKAKWDKMVDKSLDTVRACLAEGEPVKAGMLLQPWSTASKSAGSSRIIFKVRN
jgi:hypothetical protein